MGSISRPVFVCLEGLDGTGKSTQCTLLVDKLKAMGREVVFVRDPGTTALGSEIRRLLLDNGREMAREAEMSLFFAARAQMLMEIVSPALSQGKDVVLDRFLLSTIAYQGYGHGMDVERMWQAGLFAAKDVFPELTLVLDMPPGVSLGRLQGAKDRVESRGVAYFERVRAGFIREAGSSVRNIHLISAEGEVDKVHQRIMDQVITCFS